MREILNTNLEADQVGLWFLGQSGFIARAGGVTLAIDPYLSDSVAAVSPALTRQYPPPLLAEDMKVDIYIVTHDHLDHLDPETINAYCPKDTTKFVGPRFACAKLRHLGVPLENIVLIDSGHCQAIAGVEITGIYAIPNDPAVIDAVGYKVVFPNGRSFYHSGDTGFSDLLLECVPQVETVMVCINGQWGNLNIEQAATLAGRTGARYAIPHHYDLMALNSENPESFRYQLKHTNPEIETVILKPMRALIWR